MFPKIVSKHIYLLLIECEFRAVSYGPDFFPFHEEKTRVRNLRYGSSIRG